MSSLSEVFQEVQATLPPTVVATPSNLDDIVKKRSEELKNIKRPSDDFSVQLKDTNKTINELIKENKYIKENN